MVTLFSTGQEIYFNVQDKCDNYETHEGSEQVEIEASYPEIATSRTMESEPPHKVASDQIQQRLFRVQHF